MINFLEWVKLYREFGELANDSRIEFRQFDDGDYEVIHPAFWASGKELDNRDPKYLNEKLISMMIVKQWFSKKYSQYVVKINLVGHSPSGVIKNGMTIAKAIASAILKFIVQYKPPAFNFENVINFAKEWDSDNRDAVSARFLTTLNAAIKRALSIAAQSGEHYMQTGSTIMNKDAATDMMRGKDTRSNFVANSEFGANKYEKTMQKAKTDAVTNRQGRLDKMKEKDDLWTKFAHKRPQIAPQIAPQVAPQVAPQIGVRSRRIPFWPNKQVA